MTREQAARLGNYALAARAAYEQRPDDDRPQGDGDDRFFWIAIADMAAHRLPTNEVTR